MKRVFSLMALSIGLALVAGCGSSAPKTIKVSGTVTFDGQPLTKGTITFLPQTNADSKLSRPATGTIDSSGKFQLSTFGPGDGALPGKYLVTVRSYSVEPTLEEIAEKGAKHESAIPAGYNSPQTSGLTANVEGSGPLTLDFALKTGGAPDQVPEQKPAADQVDAFGT